MDAQPFNPSSFFEEKPPPSWSSPEWKWGSADGVAHEEATKARTEFAKQFRRSSLLSWAKLGSADFVELKMVLALKCQHARNEGYDASDGRWAALESEMAAAEFEPEPSRIDTAKLAEAINKRLPTPVTTEEYPDLSPEEFPAAVIAEALDHLEFKQRGI